MPIEAFLHKWSISTLLYLGIEMFIFTLKFINIIMTLIHSDLKEHSKRPATVLRLLATISLLFFKESLDNRILLSN